jgi:uncharacterized membrane protein
MGHVSHRFHIDAPLETVWEIGADCSRIPEWNVSFVEVRDCPDRTDRVGARYTAVARVLGRRLEGQWETTRVEPQKLVEEVGQVPGGGKATIVASYSAASGGTDMSIEFDYTLPGGMFSGVMEKLAAGAIERDLRHSNETFKALCEAAVLAPTGAR